MTIKDPCNRVLVDEQSLASNSDGVYPFYYNLPSAATYGRYQNEVTAKSSSGTIAKIVEEFYVMPWDVSNEVRAISGISDKKSINDQDLEHICWMSYKRALKEAFQHHYGEYPNPNVDNGQLINGSNVYFQTKHYPIADSNGDGSVTGNTTSCATDIDAWWIKEDGSYERCDVAITNADNGTIEIYQADGLTAIAQDAKHVYLDYYSQYKGYDEEIFHDAVSYLAAHYVEMRFKQADRLTMADVNRNQLIVTKNEKRFYYEYKRLINLIRKPMCGVI
jgi:hypothetical protein